MKNKKGFTLIEMLIVIAIIGILASVILVGLSSIRARGRDTRRIADLRQIQSGLELYYSAEGLYPAALDVLIGSGLGISLISKDPLTGSNYFYGIDINNQRYVLGATLEDPNNKSMNDSILQSQVFEWGITGGNPPSDCGNTQFCVSL